MSVSAVHFQGVAKSYARQPVLRGIDLEVASGQCFGLVGVNGAGKTSLLKCLLDFCAIDAGRIDIFGVGHGMPQARGQLAFLPERFVAPYYLTGRDFLRYVLSLQAIDYRMAPVETMLAALDLEPGALARTVGGYSKGMTQKLGLAACFLSDRRLLILDEPMNGLDPKARALFKRQLQRLREGGGTQLLTCHALADVDEMCDRMAILHQGRIAFIGTPQECRARYQAASLEQAFMECIGAS